MKTINKMKGLFITFEGPDASGKTTQLRLLVDYLKDLGLDPVVTREPGGTPISEKIRDIILDKENLEMLPVTEAMLYAASRSQHVREKIIPSLEEGNIVISDRFLDSSIAYQGYGRGMGDLVKLINAPATEGITPNITFLLVINPELMKKRRNSTDEDRMDAQRMEFHNAVMEGYLELAKGEPERIFLIDGEEEIENIASRIKNIIKPILKEKGFI